MFHTLHCPRCRAWLYCPGRVGASAVQPQTRGDHSSPGPPGRWPAAGGSGLSHPARPRSGLCGRLAARRTTAPRSIRGNRATLTPPGRRVAGVPWGSQARGLCPGAGPWVNARGEPDAHSGARRRRQQGPQSAAPTCARRQLNPSAAAPSRCRRQAVPGERKLSG
ncbi:hypothetical protein GQ602_007398 [Ophiocordyceps camponoti-floridani]|uniref:Uncharacterized protein n=1 Tax=Ophiocordyceps camponoti-floridani TaxID=2030778 RepID=A0A8H4VAC6_9HYPO|nr:hypothetical protein GQ602_007398 [Ophiocordyceps camponoti-floridani]